MTYTIWSGPIALLTDITDIISVTSYASITISLRVSSHSKNISGRDLEVHVIEMLEIEQKYLFGISILSISEKAKLDVSIFYCYYFVRY